MSDRALPENGDDIAPVPVEAPPDYPFPKHEVGMVSWSRAKDLLERCATTGWRQRDRMEDHMLHGCGEPGSMTFLL